MAGNEIGRRTVTAWHHTRAIVALPIVNTVVIPTTIVVGTGDLDLSWLDGARVARTLVGTIGISACVLGLVLVVRCIVVLARQGRGTLAPWDPTQTLVVGDVYRYSRNPMKLGLFLILLGEAATLGSSALASWCALFMLVNVVYIRCFEEADLRARFGPAYDGYCAVVPRWRPRLSNGNATSTHGHAR